MNKYHSMFVADLARGRKTTAAKVAANFGQGRMKLDHDAVASGMVDGVMTLAQVMQRIGNNESRPIGARAPNGSINAKKAAARARVIEIESEGDSLSTVEPEVRDARAKANEQRLARRR